MSRTKHLISLLESSEKTEFDKVVKIYLQELYGFHQIIFTDGKDDIGLDLKVFDVDGKNYQYQLTTQKSKTVKEKFSFEQKLKEDLVKANVNYKNYGYSNTLFFFYSKEVTNKQIREYKKDALLNHDINLEFIEANQIAQEAEAFVEIQTLLFKLNDFNLQQIQKSVFDNEKENLIYDLLSFGKPSEFKIQIIEAFILQSFYLDGQLSKDQLIALCEDKFEGKENNIFYEKLINQLQASKKITKTEDKLAYMLTSTEYERLQRKNNQHDIDEKIFINEISAILKTYEQDPHTEQYIKELKLLYVKNFNSDLDDLLYDTDDTKLYAIIRDFQKFIESKVDDQSKCKCIVIDLLKYCNKNKFIQKVAASKVYCGKINYNKLQNYLTTSKKIFIDTQIALHALCYYYKPRNPFNNYFYRISKSLVEFAKQERIKLFIYERYIWEIQNQIREAFNIVPFTEIPDFHLLGTSRNVLYTFYISLLQNEQLGRDITFRKFLSDFDFHEVTSTKSYNSKISSYLSKVGIETIILENTYDIEEANILFEQELDKNKKFKTKFSRNNDAVMVEFLADRDVNVHPQKPVFTTWDKTFYDVQREYVNRFPNSQNWLMLSPNKLIDAYAILKFSITAETVSENLLALISDDLIDNTHSLVDIFSYVLSPEDTVGLEYTKRIASIRQEEINKINNLEALPPDNKESEAVVDDVFYSLTARYSGSDDFPYFKQIFKTKEFLSKVIETLFKTVQEFYVSRKINDAIFELFDNLISQLKSQEKDQSNYVKP